METVSAKKTWMPSQAELEQSRDCLEPARSQPVCSADWLKKVTKLFKQQLLQRLKRIMNLSMCQLLQRLKWIMNLFKHQFLQRLKRIKNLFKCQLLQRTQQHKSVVISVTFNYIVNKYLCLGSRLRCCLKCLDMGHQTESVRFLELLGIGSLWWVFYIFILESCLGFVI